MLRGVAISREDRPELIARPSELIFLSAICPSIFTPHFHFLPSSLCHIFSLCCSHAQVFLKTFVLEFPISCSHTEWYLLFFAMQNSPYFG